MNRSRKILTYYYTRELILEAGVINMQLYTAMLQFTWKPCNAVGKTLNR